MLLGLAWHFYLVVVVTISLLYLFDRKMKERAAKDREKIEAMIPNKEVHLFGGPLNGKVEKVKDYLSFFIVPYMPDDPEEARKIGQIGENVLYAPNFAFYAQVGDPESYFYRRDLTMEEMHVYQTTGELPEDVK